MRVAQSRTTYVGRAQRRAVLRAIVRRKRSHGPNWEGEAGALDRVGIAIDSLYPSGPKGSE